MKQATNKPESVQSFPCTPEGIIASIDNMIKTGEKSTNLFRRFIGFPSAKPADMEKNYDLVKALVNKAKTKRGIQIYGALRGLMTVCRSTCKKPYTKNPKGELIYKPTPEQAEAAKAEAANAEAAKALTNAMLPGGAAKILENDVAPANALVHRIEDTPDEEPLVVEVIKEVPVPRDMTAQELCDAFLVLAKTNCHEGDMAQLTRIVSALMYNIGRTPSTRKSAKQM